MPHPQKGVAFVFDVALRDSISGEFRIDPTISAGDFKVKKDDGGFVDLVTLPIVQPAGSSNIRVNLNATEMTADRLVVEALDQTATLEWDGLRAAILTESSSDGNVGKILDILEGDHIERSDRVIINKKNTTVAVLDKQIFGSLLKSNVVISTLEQP